MGASGPLTATSSTNDRSPFARALGSVRPRIRAARPDPIRGPSDGRCRSEEHTSELQSQSNLVCRLLLEKKKKINRRRRFVRISTYNWLDVHADCSCLASL